MTVRVALFGTSWWADTMYMPPLRAHPDAEVVAVCGRRQATTEAFATLWSIPAWFTDPDDLFDEWVNQGVYHERTKVRNTPWGTREFGFYDLDMNGLHFYRDLTAIELERFGAADG